MGNYGKFMHLAAKAREKGQWEKYDQLYAKGQAAYRIKKA